MTITERDGQRRTFDFLAGSRLEIAYNGELSRIFWEQDGGSSFCPASSRLYIETGEQKANDALGSRARCGTCALEVQALNERIERLQEEHAGLVEAAAADREVSCHARRSAVSALWNGQDYTGPQYGDELTKLRATLDKIKGAFPSSSYQVTVTQ